MTRLLLLLLPVTFCLSSTSRVLAQATFPTIAFEFTSEEDNRLIKENDSLKYYAATGDTGNIVCIDEDASYYKLLTKDHKIIAEGSFILEGEKYLQVGKWTEHFPGGKVKETGYYEKSKPIGTWQEFYNTGKMKAVYNYAIIDDGGGRNSCISGSYQEFYPNGKIKVNGFYSAAAQIVTDTVTVEDPVTEKKIYKLQKHSTYLPEKIGHWEHYDESGEIEKKEDL